MTTFIGYDKNQHHEAERPPLALRKHFAKGFDYDQVAADHRGQVQQHEAAIVTLLSRCAADCIQIGKHLLEVRQLLGGKLFVVWCSASFKFGQSTVSNYCNIARRFGDADPAAIARCDIGALAELSRQRVPDAARSEALKLAAGGQRISQTVAYAISERHAPEPVDRSPASPRSPAPAAAERVTLSGKTWRGRSTSAAIGGDAETWARLSPKVRKQITNFKSVGRQVLRRQPAATRQQVAALLAAGLKDLFAEFELDEHYFLANSAAAEASPPRLKAAARQIREAGVPLVG